MKTLIFCSFLCFFQIFALTQWVDKQTRKTNFLPTNRSSREEPIKMHALYKKRYTPVEDGISLTIEYLTNESMTIVNPIDTLTIWLQKYNGKTYVYKSTRNFDNPPGDLIGSYPAISYAIMKVQELDKEKSRQFSKNDINSVEFKLHKDKRYRIHICIDSLPGNTKKIISEKKKHLDKGEYKIVIAQFFLVRRGKQIQTSFAIKPIIVSLANKNEKKVPSFERISKKNKFLERKVTINKKNLTLVQLILELQKQTKVYFFPGENLPEKMIFKKVNIINKKLVIVLDEYLLKNGMKWKCTPDGYVIIEKK